MTPAERVAIVGSRRWPDPAVVRSAVRSFVDALPAGTVVVSGGAAGVDTWAEQAARRRGLAVVVIRADWRRLGRRAGYVRNAEVVERSDRVVAFWDGVSPGTGHTVRIARRRGRSVQVVGVW